MPNNPDDAPLWDMLDAARAIMDFTSDKKAEDYLRDRMLRGAVERHLEIIGEAARKVSESFRARQPEIPWRRIIGLRNILAHEYGEIKHERIWALISGEIPGLVRILARLVPPSD
jgi:uncharacterized protein with HEPN domain